MPRLRHIPKSLLSAIFALCLVARSQQAFSWKEKGSEADCSITCGLESAVSGPRLDNASFVPYVCAVNGSEFDNYNTGTQVGTAFYVSNVLSCWVYSGNPGGPSSTAHSSYYCLCGASGNQIRNASGSTAERCSSTCSRVSDFNSSLSACQRPSLQPICFNQQEYTFGFQNSSSSSTDQSCLVVSPPASQTPQSPPASRASTFDCLCVNATSDTKAGITANCTTSSFTRNVLPPTTSQSGPSAGVIAGAVIGGLAGLALLLLLIVCLWKRRASMRRKQSTPEGRVRNAFAKPEAQLSLDLKGSAATSGDLLDFDIAVANHKGTESNIAATPSANQPSSSSSSWQPSTSSAMFVDVQARYGTNLANLPEPGHQASGKNIAEGIQSISLSEDSEDVDMGGLDQTWKIEPGDLQCRMVDGKPIVLGKGGFGEVYLGVLHREDVAIKVVTSHTERQQRRFLREIRTLRACTNPNIVQFIGACVRERHTFMVMQYMDGGNLFTRLAADEAGNFGWYKRGCQIALDIVRGLIYLHSKNIAHLDLKSPNVMLTANFKAKLGDVGLGKLVATTKQLATQEGSFLWAAPEQLLGEVCGTASDIFSFGTVLWEICTRELPENRALRPLSIPDEAPPRIAEIIDLCHCQAMDARPSATRVHDMLLDAMK